MLKTDIPERAFQRFFELQLQLEPENLCMDGEATPSQVRVRRMNIRKEWKMMEVAIGRRVTDSEVWDIWNERRAAQ